MGWFYFVAFSSCFQECWYSSCFHLLDYLQISSFSSSVLLCSKCSPLELPVVSLAYLLPVLPWLLVARLLPELTWIFFKCLWLDDFLNFLGYCLFGSSTTRHVVRLQVSSARHLPVHLWLSFSSGIAIFESPSLLFYPSWPDEKGIRDGYFSALLAELTLTFTCSGGPFLCLCSPLCALSIDFHEEITATSADLHSLWRLWGSEVRCLGASSLSVSGHCDGTFAELYSFQGNLVSLSSRVAG